MADETLVADPAWDPEPGSDAQPPRRGRVRRLVVVSAGVGQPSSTRLLADRLAAATAAALRDLDLEPQVQVIEVRDHAQDLVNNVLTLFPSPPLKAAIDAVTGADGLLAATPIFTGSYSGLFKLFFDVVERGALGGMPVLIGATGGTARHSLALDHALRPLFAYLGALVLPTGVYAAPEDWGTGPTAAEPALVDRIRRAGHELAAAMAAREPRQPVDPFEDPISLEELLGTGPVRPGSPPPPPGRPRPGG